MFCQAQTEPARGCVAHTQHSFACMRSPLVMILLASTSMPASAANLSSTAGGTACSPDSQDHRHLGLPPKGAKAMTHVIMQQVQ